MQFGSAWSRNTTLRLACGRKGRATYLQGQEGAAWVWECLIEHQLEFIGRDGELVVASAMGAKAQVAVEGQADQEEPGATLPTQQSASHLYHPTLTAVKSPTGILLSSVQIHTAPPRHLHSGHVRRWSQSITQLIGMRLEARQGEGRLLRPIRSSSVTG